MPFLTVGDPVPWFILPSTSNPTYHFDTVGGYRTMLFFFGSAQVETNRLVLKEFCDRQVQFEADNTPFFGVSIDPADTELGAAVTHPTYCKFLWDFEKTVSQQYGVCHPHPDGGDRYTPKTFVLDENLRILQIFPLRDPADYVEQIVQFIHQLPPQEPPRDANRQAPVLFIPRVFDPEFCQHLIQVYDANGGRESGFMRQVDGKTVEVLDHGFKKRRDVLVNEPALLEQVNNYILQRVKPEIEKAFQFSITRFERHLIACYEATNNGFFNRHRDNTTKGTVHRRFAMSLNLNTGEYDGGYLRFPEYGTQLYRPEAGEAVIFSCSLLHEATPITRGTRFALLSFFYDDEDAKVREQNRHYVVLKNSNQPASNGDRAQPVAEKVPLGFQPKRKKKRR
ncbi:2OG-Fe(II) oxygenase [Oculatella sp. LEGE 06141]|uniref:2OG-Fe(II) oxygenase n=1 Tax=Oculatella sp. LEGE 06141 TaxID=1828648 RepID=UPI00187EBED9|nr:2OG-Fe(II) oxygenase [Oculatella sp. LEGE 06141]MBE9182740.1 2OG-Fe(II) oxygenase [Oculatella sp. LEGE 06141]